MFGRKIKKSEFSAFSYENVIAALDKSLAVISFTPDGHVLSANQNFLSTLGYNQNEIVGKHHAIFCEPHYVRSEQYKQFWADLVVGPFKSCSSA